MQNEDAIQMFENAYHERYRELPKRYAYQEKFEDPSEQDMFEGYKLALQSGEVKALVDASTRTMGAIKALQRVYKDCGGTAEVLALEGALTPFIMENDKCT